MAQTTQSQSAAIMQREIYSVTRSEATWLVETYMNAKKKGADGGMEPYRVFRDELETAKPAYLGKFNNSSNAAVQGTFYKIATNLYKMLNELNNRVSETDHHEKTMDAAKLLPCKHSLAYLTGTFLNWSVYNWYKNKKGELIEEDLGDNGYETNTCVVCDFKGHAVFYFSTAYGLEKPVCGHCLPYDADDFKEEEAEYVVSEEASEADASDPDDASEDEESEDEEASDADDASDDEESDDEEYEPSSDREAEQDEDDAYTDSSASESETDTDDDYLPTLSDANVTVRVHQRFETPSPSVSDSASASSSDSSSTSDSSSDSSSASDSSSDSESDDDSEKSFGCSGCNYEFKQGWKTGYKAAMKEMCNYADDQKNDVPDVPSCAACGDSHECLKKCGGCKMVRYCMEDCQAKDWPEHKRVCRR